ncbi:MAG: hypothetical protein WAM75_15305, partial [Xanthobacteraceae bacterium]
PRQRILVVMMTAFTTIATAHPLIVVLTVSHDSLFRQPLLCSGTSAAASPFTVCRHLKFNLNTIAKTDCPKSAFGPAPWPVRSRLNVYSPQ